MGELIAVLDPFFNFHKRMASGRAGTGVVACLPLFLFVGVSGIGERDASVVLLRPRRGTTSGDEADLRVRNPKLRRVSFGLGGVDADDTTTSTAAVRL
jgi:hypothetical protein